MVFILVTVMKPVSLPTPAPPAPPLPPNTFAPAPPAPPAPPKPPVAVAFPLTSALAVPAAAASSAPDVRLPPSLPTRRSADLAPASRTNQNAVSLGAERLNGVVIGDGDGPAVAANPRAPGAPAPSECAAAGATRATRATLAASG